MPFDKARQAFMAADSGFQNPWAFDPNNASAGLDAGLLARLKNGSGGRALDPNGQYMVTGAGDSSGAGNNFAQGYTIMDKNGGAFWDYDPNGQFVHYRTKSMDDNWGALLPLGAAAAGMFLAGGLGGSAAGAGGGAAGAGGAVTGLADGAALDAMYGGAAMGGGAGFGGAGTAAMGAGAAGGLPSLGSLGSTISSALGGGGGSNLLGLGATALGGLAGSQGQNASQSSTRELPDYLRGPVAGDLIPRTQSLLASQTPGAQLAGNQMLSKGMGLLGETAPATATNPYLKSIADDMQRRTSDLLGQNNLAIQGNSVATGGLGGSRQGVAQGLAASRAADTLQGQLAGLYGNAYETDQNRLRQDWTIGAGLANQGVNTPFLPVQNAASVYSPFSGFGTTTNSTQSGGGWQGGVGGALAGASLGRSMGWW